MKRFQFRLQALLTLRQRSEQVALEKYAGALLERDRAVDKLDSIHRQQSAWWSQWRSQVSKGCAAGSLIQWRACDLRLSEQRKRAEYELGQAEVATNQALQEMLSARRDREVVEKHLQKQRLNYGRELSREEQKNLDDIAQRLTPLALQSHSLQTQTADA